MTGKVWKLTRCQAHVLRALALEGQTVSDLEERLDLAGAFYDPAAINAALVYLRQCGLVETEKRGQRLGSLHRLAGGAYVDEALDVAYDQLALEQVPA